MRAVSVSVRAIVNAVKTKMVLRLLPSPPLLPSLPTFTITITTIITTTSSIIIIIIITPVCCFAPASRWWG